MNYTELVKQAKKFGTRIVLVHTSTDQDQRYKDELQVLHNEIQSQGIDCILRRQEDESRYTDPQYDVVMLFKTTQQYREDNMPKTVLVVGNSVSHLDWHMTVSNDIWQWNETEFVCIGAAGTAINLDVLERDDSNPGSWINAIKISFTRLLPYAEQNILLPVYAGPIQEYAIDKVATVEIVEHIKKYLYQGYQRIAFDDKDEAIFWQRIYKVHSVIKRLGNILPPGSFFFLTSALNAEEIYTKWCKQYNEEELLVMVPCARFESVAKAMMFDEGIHGHKDELDYEISTEPRPKKFLCYNRMPRLHRVKVIVELYKRNLLSQGLVSFHNEDGVLSSTRWRQFDMLPYQESYWPSLFKYFYANIFPNLDQYKLNKTEERWNPVDIRPDDIEHFTSTYFSIINETLFYKDTYQYKDLCDISPTDSVFLSEKIFKPLACKHPFVVLGVDRTLEHLKKYGYKTFDGWIDESYDLEPDDDKRMDMCLAEIERLTKLSDEEWCEMIKEMMPTLQHNFDTLCRNKDLIVRNLNFIEIFRNDRPY